MLDVIFNSIIGMILMLVSLSAVAGLVIHGNEYTPGQLCNMAALSVACGFAWAWAFKQAGKAWFIYKSRYHN